MRRRKKKRCRGLTGLAKFVDIQALSQFSDFVGFVQLGRDLVTIKPKGEPDQMDFDCEACAAGLKQFIRPILPSDTPTGPNVPANFFFTHSHLLVTEATPGVRTRLEISVAWPERN